MKAIVLQGCGFHCFEESYRALRRVHARSELYDLRAPRPKILPEVKFILIPGGFTFGDELGAGLIMSRYLQKIHPQLYATLLDPKVVVLGICNGAQILSHTPLFPQLQMRPNRQGHFIYQWTQVKVCQESFWFNDMQEFEVCVRHGEGWMQNLDGSAFALEYTEFNNGGQGAGVLSENQFKLALMPHPEINSSIQKSNCLIENGVDYARQLFD